MSTSYRCALGAILTALSLAACGPSPSSPPPVDPPPPLDGGTDGRAFEALCFDPELYCENLYACGSAARLAEDQLLFGHTDEASCVTQQAVFTGAICAQLGASVDAGRLVADLPRLTACADYMATLDCVAFVHDPPESHAPCVGSPFLTPVVPDGGACAIDAECREPNRLCAGAGASLGRCTRAPDLSEACVDDRCREGLVCEGGWCASPDPTVCLNGFECGEGRWCDQPGIDFRVELLDPELEGKCADPLPLGAPCEDVEACGAHAYCDDTNGADADGFRRPGHCASPRDAGAPCNEPADCVSFDCDDLGTGTCR